MRGARTTLAGAAILAAATFGVTTAGSAATPPPCGPQTAHTLRQDSVARVYESGGSAYGCAVGAGRPYRLGTTRIGPGAARFVRAWLAGRTVAFAVNEFGVDTGSTTVVVQRLTSGRVLARRPATTRVGVEGFTGVDALVLKSDGAVAWVGTARSIGPPRFIRQLERLDAGGFQVLDGGGAVSPRSLRLHGSTVSWMRGTVRRTATLR